MKFYDAMRDFQILDNHIERAELSKLVKKVKFGIKGMEYRNFVSVLKEVAVFIFDNDKVSSIN